MVMPMKNLNKISINFFLFLFILFIPMKTSIYQISFGILIALFIFNIFFYKKMYELSQLFKTYKDILLGFCLIVFSMVLSNSLSDYTDYNSWKAVFYYITRYFLLFIMLLYFYSQNIFTKRMLIVYIFLSLFIQALDGIFQTIAHYDVIKHNVGSISQGLTGGTYNRNVFGFFVGIGLMVSTIITHKNYFKNFYEKTIVYLSFPIFFFCLFFSLSRGSWLMYIVFLALYSVLHFKSLTIKYYLSIFLLLLITVGFFSYFGVLTHRFDTLVAMNSSNRFEIWKDAIRLIKENYLLGYGIDTFDALAKTKIHNIHNSFLEIMYSLGILGVITFSYMLFLAIKEMKEDRSKELFAIFTSLVIATQFTHGVLVGISTLSTFSILGFLIFSKRIKTVI